MALDYLKEKIDWMKYIERRNPPFYVNFYHKNYAETLFKLTGFKFQHQLTFYNGKTYVHYRSAKEMRASDKHFLKLMKKSPEKVRAWHQKALNLLKKEEKLIKQFSTGITTRYIKEHYQEIIALLYKLFLYLTVLPFMILYASDAALAKGEDKKRLREFIEKYQAFRRRNRHVLYPVLDRLCKAAREVAGWSDFHDFSYFTIEEIGHVFKGKPFPTRKEIAQRKRYCTFYYDPEKKRVMFNYDPSFLEKIGIYSEKEHKKNELRGISTYPGKVKGRVCILNKPEEMKKFKEGDIIVSTSTTPMLTPILKRCSAIVTDEGGLTCHAAVISRELKIPCVIGTKHASKIFKDGDMIEVNAKKGIVRKISS